MPIIKLFRIQATLNDKVFFVIFQQTDNGIGVSLTENENHGTLFNGDQIEEYVPNLNAHPETEYKFSQFDTNILYDEDKEEFIEL